MKRFNLTLAVMFGLLLQVFLPVTASALPVAKQPFSQIFYLEYGKTGNCLHASSPCSFTDRDLWNIPAGTLIEKVYFIIDTAITGTTLLRVGDDDAAAGYLQDMAANFATPGLYGWDAKTGGSYLRIQTAGATDAGDIYVVPSAKFYSATGKELKLDITTANTAGKARIVVEGYYVAAP